MLKGAAGVRRRQPQALQGPAEGQQGQRDPRAGRDHRNDDNKFKLAREVPRRGRASARPGSVGSVSRSSDEREMQEPPRRDGGACSASARPLARRPRRCFGRSSSRSRGLRPASLVYRQRCLPAPRRFGTPLLHRGARSTQAAPLHAHRALHRDSGARRAARDRRRGRAGRWAAWPPCWPGWRWAASPAPRRHDADVAAGAPAGGLWIAGAGALKHTARGQRDHLDAAAELHRHRAAEPPGQRARSATSRRR